MSKELRNFIRRVVSYPGDDVIATTGPRTQDGTYELTIKTSLTQDEINLIEKRYPIVEIYGFSAEHFRENPNSDEELGIILGVE